MFGIGLGVFGYNMLISFKGRVGVGFTSCLGVVFRFSEVIGMLGSAWMLCIGLGLGLWLHFFVFARGHSLQSRFYLQR